MDLAVPALQEACNAFNHATFLTNRFIESAFVWRRDRGLVRRRCRRSWCVAWLPVWRCCNCFPFQPT